MSIDYHGKLVYFEETEEFLNALPKRKDFIDKAAYFALKKGIAEKKTMLFFPNDVLEQHFKEGNNLVYKLILIGITRDGSKAVVVLENIKPYFDIKVPVGLSDAEFQDKIIILSKTNKFYPIGYDFVNKTPFKYFQEKESNYLRVNFNTLTARNKLLNFIIEHEFEYIDEKGQKLKTKLDTASDDLSCHYRKINREYKFKLCDWNVVQNYEIDTSSRYCKDYCVEWVFRTDVVKFRDIKKIEKPLDLQSNPKKYIDLIRDKTMVGAWDTETDAAHPTGNAPMPENVFDERGQEEDVLRMLSSVFYWYWSKIPLVKDTDLVEFMKKHMSVVPWTPENDKYTIKGEKDEKIKLEAGIEVKNIFFKVPGFICIDVRTIFRQLYPTAEQSSLNFFLAVNKLGSKEDMPYQKMFKIFRLIRQLVKLFKTNKFDKLLEGLNSLRAKHGERYMPLSKTQEENPFPAIDNTSYNVDKLNISEMLELVMLSSQVVHYCNVDAQRCQDLLNIRSIISDRREMSNL